MARWEWWGIFICTSNALSSLASRTFGSFMTGRRQPLNWRQRSRVCSRGMQLRTFPLRSSAKLTTWKIRFWLLKGHTTANTLFTTLTSTTLFANHCKRRVTWEGMIENKSETYKCLRAENNLFRTLVPEVFLEFSPRERAAKRRMRVAKRLCNSHSPLRGSLTRGKFKKNLWDQGTFFAVCFWWLLGETQKTRVPLRKRQRWVRMLYHWTGRNSWEPW